MYVQVKSWSNTVEIPERLLSSLPVAADHIPHKKDIKHPGLMLEVAQESDFSLLSHLCLDLHIHSIDQAAGRFRH